MDNQNTQPQQPVQPPAAAPIAQPVQPVPPMPQAPAAAEPTPFVAQTAPLTPPSQPSDHKPLIYSGIVLFLVILAGALYYIFMPSASSTAEKATTQNQAVYTAPSPTAVPTISENTELETFVTYSLEDSFAELEKDLAGL